MSGEVRHRICVGTREGTGRGEGGERGRGGAMSRREGGEGGRGRAHATGRGATSGIKGREGGGGRAHITGGGGGATTEEGGRSKVGGGRAHITGGGAGWGIVEGVSCTSVGGGGGLEADGVDVVVTSVVVVVAVRRTTSFFRFAMFFFRVKWWISPQLLVLDLASYISDSQTLGSIPSLRTTGPPNHPPYHGALKPNHPACTHSETFSLTSEQTPLRSSGGSAPAPPPDNTHGR